MGATKMISTERPGSGGRNFTTQIGAVDQDGVLIVQRVTIPDPDGDSDIDVSSQVRLSASNLRLALRVLEE